MTTNILLFTCNTATQVLAITISLSLGKESLVKDWKILAIIMKYKIKTPVKCVL